MTVTVTTDSYLDSVPGTRVSGEQWQINGCTLTIRTDTAVYAGAPANMTGFVSGFFASNYYGGGIKIDSTKIRWMKFDSASGNVPIIGTMITQGGVSGYLLGVWPDYTSAPVTPGSAMPSTGYLKFREVTGGTFTPGALLGITANSSSTDVDGWIEVKSSGSGTFSAMFGLSTGLTTRGNWLYLDDTTGIRGQTIQVPTNGGGINTHVISIQIETSPGSNEYDWWIGQTVANGFTSTDLTTIDDRAKLYLTAGNGVIILGSDGTNNVAACPVSGCKVRIPNIFIRQCTAPSPNTLIPSSTANQNAASSGIVDIEFLHCDTGLLSYSSNVFRKFTIKHSCFLTISATQNSLPSLIEDVATGGYLLNNQNYTLRIDKVKAGLTLKNSTICNSMSSSSGGPLQITSSNNVYVENIKVVSFKKRLYSSGYSVYLTGSSNLVFNNIKVVGYPLQVYSNDTVEIINYDFTNDYSGDTTTSAQVNAIELASGSNVILDGLTFGENNKYPNTNCYGYIVNVSAITGYLKIRNIGNATNSLNCGTGTVLPYAFINTIPVGAKTSLQRIYLSRTRSVFCPSFVNGNFLTVEHCYLQYGTTDTQQSNNSTFRGNNIGYNYTNVSNVTGMNWIDFFLTTTTGNIYIIFNAPNDNNAQYITTSFADNLGTGWQYDGALSMDTFGDYVVMECPYVIKGHTGFDNVEPYYSGNPAGGYLLYYQLDKGTGYSGTWQLLTAANLSAETNISPSGFKIKVKIQYNYAPFYNGQASMKWLRMPTITTAEAQANNLYPLDTNTLSFTGLALGSEVRCYQGTDPATSVEIGGIESTSGSTFSFSHSSGGTDGYITILAMGFQPVRFNYTFKSTDDSILIQPVIDRNYVNPV